MTNQQLLDFIRLQLKQGISREKITTDLLAIGYSQVDIEKSFQKITLLRRFKKWSLAVFIFFVIPIVSFYIFFLDSCYSKTISVNSVFVYPDYKIDSFNKYWKMNYSVFSPGKEYGFYPVETVFKYRSAEGLCGDKPKPVGFEVTVYEDIQKTKILAHFNNKQLKLKGISWMSPKIIILPYSDTEYEIIIDTSGPLSFHFKVNKDNKSVVFIQPSESKLNLERYY